MTDPAQRIMAASGVPFVDVIVALIFLGLAIAGVVFWGRGLWMAWKSAKWPTVTGTIISSKIVIEDIGEGATRHAAKLAYEYRVAGQVYRGDRLEWSDGMVTGFKRRQERIVAVYPAGRSLTVYYDPADPSRAVLEPRRMRELLTTGVMVTVVVALAVWLMLNGLTRPESPH